MHFLRLFEERVRQVDDNIRVAGVGPFCTQGFVCVVDSVEVGRVGLSNPKESGHVCEDFVERSLRQSRRVLGPTPAVRQLVDKRDLSPKGHQVLGDEGFQLLGERVLFGPQGDEAHAKFLTSSPP